MSDCCEWTKQRFKEGYGRIYIGGKPCYVHRVVWEMFNGPIPAKHDIHHKCENRACWNPDHLEVLTRKAHVAKSERVGWAVKEIGAKNLAKMHCRNGHEYAGANLYIYPNGERGCRACNRAAQKRYAARKKANNV